MQRHPDYTRERIRQLAERIQGQIYADARPVTELLVSPRTDRIPFAEAASLPYRPAVKGEQFGPLWATYWFKAQFVVPPEWNAKRLDLLWISHSEATLWMNGRSIQGLNHEPISWDKSTRPDAVLRETARGGEPIEFQIEMACNRVFGNPVDRGPYSNVSLFVLDRCDVAVFDRAAWDLYFDLAVLQELEAESAKDLDKSWGGELLAELNRFANMFDLRDRSTWDGAHAILKQLYSRKNATRVHELSAIGHAHIDTAWLWPLAETWRKCERTFSSATTYMDAYPDYRFACSQAYQYAIIEKRNPDLFERIRAKVANGQWVPVGGTWIEPDCNIPSGESLARQFLVGQRYFKKTFGATCKEFWNPDVFGYNGQLPQLMRQSGITRFLTQKLSWNKFNKPAFHTFTWQGIDGSEVLAHFPPADTYNAVATVAQFRDNARNYKDHDRSRHSLMLFGYGDGGGGPTKRMLEYLRRAADLQGLPRTRIESSDEFFTRLENDITDRPLMIGELYFELHRGTYTTQALTKKNNRKNEFLLHDAEFLAAAAFTRGATYPHAAINEAWEILLLNQFHDILPGSSITEVYSDAARDHERIREIVEPLRGSALAALRNTGGSPTPINTLGVPRAEVAEIPGGGLAFVTVPAFGSGKVSGTKERASVTKRLDGAVILENSHLRAELDANGRVTSLVEKQSGREALTGPANQFKLYEDYPTNWDAWEIDPSHLETARDCSLSFEKIDGSQPLSVSATFCGRIGAASSLSVAVSLTAGSRRLEFSVRVDWQEEHKMLKAAFPVNVRAMNATYEMQFGTVERPTHFNNSYDLAKFEVPAHRWVDLSEHGFGVALLNDCKYGFSTFGNTMTISLLRSPKWPDPVADIGVHHFSYALVPHAGGWREAGIVAEALRFNAPIEWAAGVMDLPSLVNTDDPNVIIDTVKKAEDSDALIVRLYETHGARGIATIRFGFPAISAVLSNILEEDGEALAVDDGAIRIPYAPFKIVTLKVRWK